MVIAGASPRSSRGESGIRVRIPGTGSQPLQPVPPFRSMLNQVEAPGPACVQSIAGGIQTSQYKICTNRLSGMIGISTPPLKIHFPLNVSKDTYL